MRNVAIITARGGSKRIPKKNIKKFCGKPIITYSIEAALDSGIFCEVMVSTDSEEIADIAVQYGATVPFLRSEGTSNDYATTDEVITEVLENYDALGREFDLICCIYPTAPLITSEDIRHACELLIADEDADSVIPIVKYSFPPQRAFIVCNDYVQYQFPENALKRSQDLEPIYHDCGMFYVSKVISFKKYHDLLGKKSLYIEIPEERVQDIDTLSDWALAEIKYRLLKGE